MAEAVDRCDFFISRAGADREAALVVDEILRAAGFTTYIQDRDFGTTAFTKRMDDGLRMVEAGARIVALLSGDYMASPYCMVEAQHPLADDPFNERQRLIVLRIEDCTPLGLLKQIAYVDLVPLLDDAAALGRAVLGAVAPGRDPQAARLAALHRRSGRQILHPAIRSAPDFSGRASELAAVDTALCTKPAPVALTGMAGVGKSLLAQQYAWDNHERYAGVWWIAAASREGIVADLVALGARLIPGLDETPDRARAARLALDALAQAPGARPWLLVYDNVETPDALADLTPAAGAHVLVTTRWADWYGRATEIALSVFARPVAMDYLLTRARKSDGAAAGRLAEDVGRLPLALAHARATAWAMGLDFDAYRALLPELIKRAPRGADYPEPVYATFDQALARAMVRAPQAERLMGIAAFLAPERMPIDIIGAEAMSPLERGEAVAALTEMSLATLETLEDGTAGLSVHRMVQAVMRARLGERAGEHAALAIKLVADAFPRGERNPADVRTWDVCRRLEEHARAALARAADDGETADVTAHLLHNFGLYLGARAQFEEAEQRLQRSLAITERRCGGEHPAVATVLGALGTMLGETSRPVEAERLLRRALSINESAWGADHASTASSLNDLAMLLLDTGRPVEAEPLIRRALAITEQSKGSDHPETALRLSNLSGLLGSIGRRDEAEPLLRRALSITEKYFGGDHPFTAATLANLAAYLIESGELAEAEGILRRALAIVEASEGPKHPHVAVMLGNLAQVLRSLNRHGEALALARRALEIDELVFEPEHPAVARSCSLLAAVLLDLGRPAEADAHIRHALLAAERSLGPDHPETKLYRADYERIIAAIEAIARQDEAVEAGRAPAPPERLARHDVPPPARRGLLARLLPKRG